MKYNILCLLALAGMLMLFACGKDSPLSPDTQEQEQAITLEKTQRTEFTARAVLDIIEPGNQFVDKKGASHVHDQVLQGRLLIDGTNRDWAIRLVTKYKIYPKGRGNGRGTVLLVTEEGTWEGHHRVRFDDSVASGVLKCRLGNKKMKMRFQEVESDTEFQVLTIQGLLKEYK